MPDDKEKVFQEKNLDNKPVAVVVNSAGMLGSYLVELLLSQGSRVVSFVDLEEDGVDSLLKLREEKPLSVFEKKHLETVLENQEKISYFFYLPESVENLRKKKFPGSVEIGFLKKILANKKAKICFVLDITPNSFGQISEDSKKLFSSIREPVEKENLDLRIVETKFIYGPRMNLERQDVLTKMISSAVYKESVKVSGSGDLKLNPTFISDVVYAIGKSIFSSSTSGKIFSAISGEEVSLINLTSKIRDIFGDVEVRFVSSSKPDDFPREERGMFERGDLRWSAKVDLETGLSQTFRYFNSKPKKVFNKPSAIAANENVVNRLPKKEQKQQKTKTKKKIGLLYWLVSLVLVFFIIGFSSFGVVYYSLVKIPKAFAFLQKGDFEKATRQAKSSEKILFFFEGVVVDLDSVFSPEEQTSVFDKTATSLLIAGKACQALGKAGEAAEGFSLISEKILKPESQVSLSHEIAKIKNLLDEAYISLSEIEILLEKDPSLLAFLQKDASGIEENLSLEKIAKLRSAILQVSLGVDLIPVLTGVHSKKTYLVLLQNNMELRPTGGFIGSYALLVFDKGKLIDFEVEDVYEADGQLKGHVEPPEELRRYLGEAGWYLRDSNFDPSFPVSAVRAMWFLEKETGRVVDGVVGLNLFVVQKILESLGPIEITDYQETVSAENLFDKAEHHAEIDFFPGSKKKKNFLSSLSSSLFEKIKVSGKTELLALGSSVASSLSSKDIMLYFDEKQVGDLIYNLGWDGGIKKINCIIEGYHCIADYLMLVEANLGVNKANYFVERKVSHQVNLGKNGEITEELQIIYQNNSKTEIFPGGSYKNYLRILVPGGSEIEKVLIDDQEVKEKSIFVTDISGKTSFGFLVNVPIMEKMEVRVKYSLAEKFDLSKKNKYLLYLQKQSGIEDKIFDLVFNPKGDTLVESTKPKASIVSGLAVFSTKIDKDRVFEIDLK
ncbi:MAG: DUF4012 domain-containing protein [Patescibacteria group bacterium]